MSKLLLVESASVYVFQHFLKLAELFLEYHIDLTSFKQDQNGRVYIQNGLCVHFEGNPGTSSTMPKL